MILAPIFIALCLVFTVVFCIVRAKKATYVSLSLKTLASICFVTASVLAMVETTFSTIGILITTGLCFGLVGDVVLDLKVMYPEKNDALFISGTLAFAFGHACYFASALLALLSVTTAPLAWILPVAVVLGVLLAILNMFASKKMGMEFGKVKWLVAIYSFILIFMTIFSIFVAIYLPIFWIFAGGMVVFLLSDLILSMQYFGGKSQKIFIYLNHIAYYVAQCMFVLFILFM